MTESSIGSSNKNILSCQTHSLLSIHDDAVEYKKCEHLQQIRNSTNIFTNLPTIHQFLLLSKISLSSTHKVKQYKKFRKDI